MMAKPDDLYGTFGSVPKTENQGVSNAGISAHATPEAFGSQISEAEASAGKEVSNMANHFGQMVVEAKVNDDYANKYVPAAANLRMQYDNLRGQDKVAGYDGYIKGLKDLNTQFTGAQQGFLGQKSMSSLINKHIEGEVFGAKRELVESQKAFSDQATYDMLKANNSVAASNYNNPQLVNSLEEQNNNHILINHIDAGHDPNHPESKDLIESAQKNNTSQMATGMIKTALNSGDAKSANNFRSRYASVIPGYEKLAIDNTLHAENIKQTSNQSIDAIKTGRPIPEAIGAPAAQVQALVANTAKSSEIDPNHALAVLRIESSDGQNLGKRGTLGQDKASAGKSMEEQAAALCDNLKKATNRASDTLGRQAEPWEGYAVYQQGHTGGPALLSAAQDTPDKKAVDVLLPLYENHKDALSAVTNNGGNVTMSASDFVDHIKKVYDDNSKRANCDFSNGNTPGEAITKPHEQTGVTIQPAASPVQALINFDKKAPQLLDRINSISNYEVRAGVMKAYNAERQRYQDSATAYTNVLVNQAGQLAASKDFTSMDQVPPEMMAALTTDHPATITMMEGRAEYNNNHAHGNVTKDMKEYGTGITEGVKAIWDGRITNVSQINEAYAKGDLTIAGHDYMEKELKKQVTPISSSEAQAKKLFYEAAKKQISPFSSQQGIQNFTDFFIQSEQAYNKGIAEGKTSGQLLTSTSPDYIGKNILQLKRSQTQLTADMAETNKTESDQIAKEIKQFNTMSPDLFPQYARETREKLRNPNIDDATKKKYTNTLNNLKIIAASRGLVRMDTEPRAEIPSAQ